MAGRPAPDAACVAAMMETHRRQGRPQAALDLLGGSSSSSSSSSSGSGGGGGSSSQLLRPPDHHLTLAAAIRALSDLGRAREGVALFEQAAAEAGSGGGGGVDGGCYAAALDALADVGDADGALRLLEAMHAQDEEAVTSVSSSSSSSSSPLPWTGAAGRGERGPVARSRLRVGRQHYVAVLRACAKAGMWTEALELVNGGMRARSGVRPDEKCFRWALFACCAAGRGETAGELLRRRDDVPWSLPCYTTGMRALAKAERWDGVLALWELLLARHLAPDAATGDVALSAAGAARAWDRAEGVLGEMQRRGIEPYEAGYGVVIEGRCQQGRLGDALALLRRVRRPNVVMYTSILCALGRQGKVRQALALLKEMEGQKGIAPDQVALTCVVDACLKVCM
jgi:pentatricopeptide repeat protein